MFSELLSKKQRRNGWLLLIAGLVLLCIVPLGTMAIYTEFFSPDPLPELYDIAAMTSPSKEVDNFVGEIYSE